MPNSLSNRSFWPAFQKRWAAVLCEQTEGLSAWSESMTQALRRGIVEVPNTAEAHTALAHLNTRLARLESADLAPETLSLDETTRSMFVRYGSAILCAPPAERSASAMSYGEVKLLLGGLCDWLQALKNVPRHIFCLEDFDSQILACVLAHQLNVEFSFANGDGFTHSKSLIVSASNRSLIAAPLRTVFPSQVLYAFNLIHEGGTIVPDVSSVSRVGLVLPWHNPRTPEPVFPNVPDSIIEGIIESILSATVPTAVPDWSARVEFYRSRRDLLTAGNSRYTRASLIPEIP